MLEENDYYIAELGVEKSDIVERCVKSMNIFGTSFDALEVFDTPFEAIRALNETMKLMPEHHVTVFAAANDAAITISNNSESKTLIRPIIEDKIYLKKYCTMALGSLVYSL